MFFFFQPEDGIRDIGVTGVQTCALPICTAGAFGQCLHDPADAQSPLRELDLLVGGRARIDEAVEHRRGPARLVFRYRSGERRGGEEGRSRGSPDSLKKKKTYQDNDDYPL